MNQILHGIFTASRPISWVNTAFPYGLAYLISGGSLDILWAIGVIFFLIPYNIALYGINDVFDYESDIRNPRKGGIEGAVLPRSMHSPLLWASFLTTAPFLIVLFAAGTWVSALWLTVTMFALVAYSAPHLRFKERPVLDSVTSSAHFTGPALVGATITGGATTHWFTLSVLAFFLWGMASHAFGAVQDILADRDAGLSSTATVLGARLTSRISTVLYLMSAIILFVLPMPGLLVGIAALGYVLITARYWNITDETCEQANSSWRVFLGLNYFSGAVVTISLAWVLL
jgi:4-hydroxybenzoate polyprenyltransferase